MALTVKQVEHAKPGERLGDGNGLWLFVAASGSRSWLFRFTSPVTRKPREMGIGPAADVKLVEAREAAQQARKLVLAGKDPIEERNAQRAAVRVEAAKAITFEEYAKEYIGNKEAGWRNEKHRQQWTNSLKAYAYPVIGAKPVPDIISDDIVSLLAPIWLSKKETAARVRGRIEKIMERAIAKKKHAGPNPALLGIVKHDLPEQKRKRSVRHHPALPHAEMPKFWKSLAADTSDAAHMLRWIILTVCRFGEARYMNPDEAKSDIWTIPAGRIKGEQEHKVPLVPQAVALLPLRLVSDVSLTKCIRRHTDSPASTHGMRSTFRNWIRDTGRDETLGELALAHTVGNETERAYARSDAFDRRRKLMQEWSEYCSSAK
jgi:integrase